MRFMQKNLIIALLLVILIPCTVSAHKKASFNIIVDTDAGIDDVKMMHLLMVSADFNINTVVCSDGVLSPKQGASRVRGMLDYYGHFAVPVAAGKALEKPFDHRDFARKIAWPGEKGQNFKTNAVELLHNRLNAHPSKDIYLASGPLTNLATLLKAYPDDINEISRIIWYHNPENKSMNYQRDQEAAGFVLNTFPDVEFVCADTDQSLRIEKDDLLHIESLNNKYSKGISDYLIQKDFRMRSFAMHLQIWDELLPLYLLFPERFSSVSGQKHVPLNPEDIRMLYVAILDTDKPMQGIVYNTLPASGTWLREDVREIADSIISRHGFNEFAVVAMTSEFHGHLGIYSIIGAKMGLLAMQAFHVGLDELEVWSYAGDQPPLSCLHDGIQFSTGASLGYGSIHVPEGIQFKPEAVFEYKGQQLKIRLKKTYVNQFQTDIAKTIETYGLLTDKYWEEIRRIGLDYWLRLDKDELFDVESLSVQK
jgi:pyrimidine-specific ribonucleoside hydrolase